MNAYLDCMRRYFSLTGRLSRSGYWQFMLGIALLALVGVFIDYGRGHQLFAFGGPGLATLLILGAHFLPFVAASVRRIHDSDQTGWLYWLIYIPVLGWVPFLGLMLAKGTDGSNRYGSRYEVRPSERPFVIGSYQQPPAGFEFAPEKPIESRAATATVPNAAVRPVAAALTTEANVIDQLERLAALRASGGLTEEEFTALKASLWNKAPR